MKDSVLSYKYFRSGAAWIFFILGIVLYYIGYFQIDSQSVWKEILIKGGDILIIGVILGYLSNAAQFLGIFKQDLQDIIYGKEFIKQRKDITPLWETISKQMFKNKFPAIHKEFLKVINGYFPENEVSFYNDYESHITIEWIDSKLANPESNITHILKIPPLISSVFRTNSFIMMLFVKNHVKKLFCIFMGDVIIM